MFVMLKLIAPLSLIDQTRTHNHPTTRAIADSYVGSESIDGSPDVQERVADMVGVRAEPKLVTSYISRLLSASQQRHSVFAEMDLTGVCLLIVDRHVTPQQARNIIQRIQSSGTSQMRLKTMLHTFVQTYGNDALLIQDDNSMTVGIVIQTLAQKKCFEEWGECLVMDWTHATNNIGYHLGTLSRQIWRLYSTMAPLIIAIEPIDAGSLLVTTPTGRGILVIDFVAVDEKASTMRAVLDFFKQKNTGWTGIETFVIDKDFVEWAVLNECFPSSMVLLCQFHAITYWRKLLVRRVYDLKIAQREMLEAMFARMLKR
jgi:hypothetical protein